jgi:hypothetical protein
VRWAASYRGSPNYSNLLLSQTVKVSHEAVDLGVSGGDLAIQGGFLLRGFSGGGQALVEGEHLLHELNNVIVAGRVGRVAGVGWPDADILHVMEYHTI